ncbi:MAG: inositol monophosphatase family protein [Methylococcaceae bacterium]
MELSELNLQLLAEYAVSAAHKAGQLIAKYAQKPIVFNTKKSGSSQASQVVTEVDHLSQAVILQTLAPTCETYDLALLTEESPDDRQRLQKDFFWCVDPLDGTLAFVQSKPGYSVSIALVSQLGEPYIGIIYDPLSQTLYQAVKGKGILKNGKPFLPKQLASSTSILMMSADPGFLDHPFCSEIETAMRSIAKELGYHDLKIQIQAGAAMNTCSVLENNPACYFKFPKPQDGGGSLWDFAASACLFVEAGAVVSDIYGNTLALNSPDSTFMNKKGVLYASNIKLAKRIRDLYIAMSK